jgi:short-subunit dehydrogenase
MSWLITGATDGIGLALARKCQQLGVPTILLGRKTLAELPPDLFTADNYLSVDLAAPTAAEQVTTWLDAHGVSRLRGLVHNAATGWVGNLVEQAAESIGQIHQVNVAAPILLTRALASRIDRVVFISSVVAEWGAAGYAVYAASKAALNAFARSLRAEQPGFLVQTLHLGAVRTGLHHKCGWDVSPSMLAKFALPTTSADWIWRQMEGSRTQATMGVLNGMIRWLGEVAKFPRAGSQPARTTVTEPLRILITGASQGIGAALVAEFQARGCSVTGVDVQPCSQEILTLDLGQPSTWDSFWPLVNQPFDLVIHNAGISATGAFASISEVVSARVLAVNFLGPMRLNAELFARGLISAQGDFIFISSLSYYAGYPGASVYAATKAGLAAYGNGLRAARKASGGRVLNVFPGPVRTAHAREHSPDNRYEHKRMEPTVLASAIYAAWQRGSQRLVPGVGNKLSALLAWLFPRTMTALMRRIIFLKMQSHGQQ